MRIAQIPRSRSPILTTILLRLGPFPRPAVVVFALFLGFSALFGLIVPATITGVYGINLAPQDFYPMGSPGGDFVATYAAANRLLRGEPIYDTIVRDPASTDPYGRLYSYPPLHVYAFVPLALLPFKAAYLFWLWLTLVLIITSCLLAARMTEAPALVFIALLLIYAQSSFLRFQLERGQTDAPTLIFMVAMISAYAGKRRNIYLAGLWLALATLIKALPAAFVVFFLLRREFRLLFVAAAIGVVTVLVTGISSWTTWATQAVPFYAGYFLGSNVDHSLYYFFEGFTHDLRSAITLARATATILLAVYAEMVLFNRYRSRLLLLELAIFVTTIEIATPWSANYKQVVLLFLFMSPFAILQIPFVRRHPIRFVTPLFAAFVLIVPVFGEYLARLPYSIFAMLVPDAVVIANPLNPFITDRKVVVGLLVCLFYLLALYAASTLPLGRAFAGFTDRLRAWGIPFPAWHRVLALAVVCLAIVAIGPLWWESQRERAAASALVASIDPEVPVNDSVSVSGYQVRYDTPNHYTLTFVYHVHAAIHENLQFYLHTNTRDSSGNITPVPVWVSFPSVITSFWPTDKYIVDVTDAYFEVRPYSLSVAMVDLSNARLYGEASLGALPIPAP